MRYFNTAGPANRDDHYCLDPLGRVDLPEILGLIEQEKYFVLHAPRQTGKTTCLLALCDHLNATSQYRALYANLEAAQAAREDVAQGIRAVVEVIARQAKDTLADERARPLADSILSSNTALIALDAFLTEWCRGVGKPTVLLLDEVDALVGDTLISLLRQLRSGYPKRPALFPQTVVLCGVRDVRDYRIHSSREQAIITGGSAFNIKAKSLRLGDFTRADVESLYAQHTTETGQCFEPAALDRVWDLTSGQPWLVNALAEQACFERAGGKDRSIPVGPDLIEAAKDDLILHRVTHLDQLTDKLKEDRVRRVIQPVLEGKAGEAGFVSDDVQYVVDLGLVRQAPNGAIEIANRIYQEVIPRELAWNWQSGIEEKTEWYVTRAGRLDMDKLLQAFQQFFRENSEIWLERFDYKEAGPQLLLQAFLQRIVNGAGRIDREYGLGRKRTDLLILWPMRGATADGRREAGTAVQRVVVELKILHRSLEQTVAEGLEQTRSYMDACGAQEGHLLVFDRTPGKPWEEKVFRRVETCRGAEIAVWGL